MHVSTSSARRQIDSQVAAKPPRAPASPPPTEGRAPAIRRAVDQDLPLARVLASAVARRQLGATLQRQDDAAAAPLTAAQVVRAIGFYRQQPRRYTPAIIVEIQAAVGVPQTGAIDAQTVQGVAVWQRDNGGTPPEQELEGAHFVPDLKVDGMAGPRTLPRMFAHGLNVKSEGLVYGREAQAAVIDRWHTMTPDARATELVRLVNARLDTAGVPPVAVNTVARGEVMGEFDGHLWQMTVSLTRLSPAQPDVKQARRLVATVYHEARHAEQRFRMAQLRAAQLRTTTGAAEDRRLQAAVAADVDIPPPIAKKAIETPLAAGSMQALIAQGWYDSEFGAGRAESARVTAAAVNAANAAAAAQQRQDAHPSAANEAALRKANILRQKTFNAYRELPLENDASTTAPMTAPGVTSGAPAPPPPSPPPPPTPGGAAPTGPSSPGGPADDLERLVGAGAP